MSTVSSPPTVLLKHITDFISTQDGSKTLKQLRPDLLAFISRRSSARHTEKSLSDICSKTQQSVRRLRSKNNVAEQAAHDYHELRARVAAVRGDASRKAKLLEASAHIVRAFKTKKVTKPTTRSTAEEKLVEALAALRDRNVAATAEERKAEEDEKERRREVKRARREAKEAKKVADREEKQAAEEQKQAREDELKLRQSDVRALQALQLKAKQINLEVARQETEVRKKRIDGKFEHLLDLMIAKTEGSSSERKEEVDDMDDNKENEEPESEWQV